MKISRINNSTIMCEDCLKDYPDSPLLATTIIDMRYVCDVHADECINQDLYDKIDEEYSNLDEED
jgi:hypothetical protein